MRFDRNHAHHFDVQKFSLLFQTCNLYLIALNEMKIYSNFEPTLHQYAKYFIHEIFIFGRSEFFLTVCHRSKKFVSFCSQFTNCSFTK